MKIISLQAENIKRLVAVEIRPDGNLVEITGKNGQGKTSVLDSIWWALDGKEAIQSRPIRNGFHEASIIVVLGEDKPQLIVTRTFKIKPDGETTTSLMVESPEGAKFGSPQKMLDAFLGALTFDPLAFARMKPREQYDELKRFVPGVDFDAIANQNRGDRDRRTELNRAAKQDRGAAAVIHVPEGTTTERINEAALVEELSEAGEFNASIETRKVRRQQVADNIIASRNRASQIRDGGTEGAERIRVRHANQAGDLRDRITKMRSELQALEDELEAVPVAAEKEVREYQGQVERNAEQFEAEAAVAQKQLDEAEPLPAPIDTDAVRKRIAQASILNAEVAKLVQRNVYEARAVSLEAQAEALTQAIADREAAKNAAIAAAAMPVAGITFGEDEVLLNGVPFNQGSDAEQLAASVDIAMAMNPKLRVVRIRDGSLLDPDSMKLLDEKAAAKKMQVWIERVDASGKIGFVIEDGHVRKAAAAAVEESAA